MKKNIQIKNLLFSLKENRRKVIRHTFTFCLLAGIFELSTSFTTNSAYLELTDKDTLVTSVPHISDIYYRNYIRDTSLLANCGYQSCEVPVYDEKIYTKRLKGIQSTIPLSYNKYVKGYIDLYLFRKRCLSSKIIGRSYDYFPMFEESLRKSSMPVELKNLAIVESALNREAKSPAGALGIWQFMPVTGRIYKLRVDSVIDERKDPILSTDAAVRYLRDLHRIYKDWLLAIAAYNCGPGNVNKAIRKAKRHRRQIDFWAIKPYLPVETQGYVPAFIASCYLMKHYPDHNLRAINPAYLTSEVRPLEIKSGVAFQEISKRLKITPEEITYFNPDYETAQLIQPSDTIPFSLPVILHREFYDNERDIYAASSDKINQYLARKELTRSN